MATPDPLAAIEQRLPRQWRLLSALRDIVTADRRLRWLDLGCSLGAGRGDHLSDVDVGIGYAGTPNAADLERAGLSIARAAGRPVDAIVHRLDGWPDGTCRVAAEYDDGAQLDLVLLPAEQRPGRPDGHIVLVDKDRRLVERWVPASSRPPSADVARQWVFLGWWALSAGAKYGARGSWFEAVEALAEARKHALCLFAAGADVPYPSFGLTSLLDVEPIRLPAGLAASYCTPADPDAVVAALRSCASLLGDATTLAASRLGTNLRSGLADAALRGLADLAA